MAATNIGSNKYPLAKMPALADAADIQVALKYYHWGQEAEPEGTATAGISKYLDDIDGRIDALETDIDGVILESTINAKGDLIVGTANDTVDRLASGSDGYFLKANSSETTGLQWSALPSATTSGSGIVQLSDSTSTTSSILAATPTAVKSAYDLANTKASLNYSTNAQTGTSYSLVKQDNGYIVEMNNPSANTVTIPLNAGTNGDFAVGSQVTIIQTGAGQTTVLVTSGVTLNCTPQGTVNTAKLRAQYSSCTLIKRATDTWIAIGDLVA